MIAELGLFSLILALLFAILLAVIPTLGLWFKRSTWQHCASTYVYGQFIFIAIAYICLTICFLRDDFTVIYVLSNSSQSLPSVYKLCAVWGGHEGSMLLWVAILSTWMVAVTYFSKRLDDGFRTRVLVVLGMLSIGFILFLLTTSNPFTRQFQVLDSSGRDLNPLLQDIGFLFHPPMLYMGYVGSSVAFAFAIAALWMGQVQSVWAKWVRPWTLAAWCCLTLGITLGSWWAYRELGWGGWWFWDPVENASFMPWLISTALLHSLAVSEKRQQFLAWTLLLAITGFSLSLIGTFLVRSGVLISVHAFAVDPARGLYILLFLLFVIGGSLLLFIFRAQTLSRRDNPHVISRDSALLFNNVILVSATLTVLMGTVYPLLMDGLGFGKLSVGAPYFNTVFVPLMVPLLALMGLGLHLRWQRDHLKRVFKQLSSSVVISLTVPMIVMLLVDKRVNLSALLGLCLACWIITSTLTSLFLRIKQKKAIVQSYIGMLLAHLGVAVSVIGVTMSSGYGQHDDIKLSAGVRTTLAGYSIQLVNEVGLKGVNYHGSRVCFHVTSAQHTQTICPEKRIYDVTGMPMTESAIDVTPFRDIYIALGDPLDNNAWTVRLYYKPFVRWIWSGGFLMMLGGFVALTDRRYYIRSQVINV